MNSSLKKKKNPSGFSMGITWGLPAGKKKFNLPPSPSMEDDVLPTEREQTRRESEMAKEEGPQLR